VAEVSSGRVSSGRVSSGRVSSGRARHGRPTWWQAGEAGAAVLRVVGAVAVGVVAVVIAGWSPGVVGVLTGVLTWLLLTGRHALSRRRSN
jgi:hypothetical protein